MSMVQALCFAQTDMFNSQYVFEKTFITPANFTQQEKLKAFANYQTTSGNDRGGEEYIYSLAGNYKLNEKSLFGVNIVNSKFGQESSLLGYLNYTYNLLINDNAYLSNGFGFGFQQYRLNLREAIGVDPNDPLNSGNIYSSKFDFRLGSTVVINKRTYFGVSFDNVLSRYNNQNETDVNYLPNNFRRINMTFMMGNRNSLDADIDVIYEGFYSYNFGGLSTLDLNAKVEFGNLIGGGLSYRRFIRSEEREVLTSGVIRPYLTLNVGKKNNFMFNYAYGFSPNQINTVGLNTHEFGVAYRLP